MTLHSLTIFVCGIGVGAVGTVFATAFYMVREMERPQKDPTR